MRTSLAIRDKCLDITSKYLVVTTKKKRSRYNYLVIMTINMVIVRNFLKNIRFNSSIKKNWFEKIFLDFIPFFFELDCLHRFKVSFFLN